MSRPITLSREQLYDLVWSKPMRDAAKEFLMSDVGLKKACTRRQVPVPPRGYWNKLRAGKPVIKLDLMPFRETPRQAVGSSAMSMPLREKQARSSKAPVATTPPSRIHKTAEALRRAELDKRGLLVVSGNGIFETRVSREAVPRAVALWGQFCEAAEKTGYLFTKNSSPVRLVVNGEGIGIAVSETTVRKERPRVEGDEHYYRTFGPYWDYVPTGRLSLSLAGSHAGLRTHWTDATSRRVEAMVDKILSVAVAHAAAKKDERRAMERRQIIAMHDRQREQDETSRRAEEMRRVDFLSERAGIFDEAERFSSFLHYLQRSTRPSERSAELADFLGWGWAYVDRRRALCGGSAIEAALSGGSAFRRFEA